MLVADESRVLGLITVVDELHKNASEAVRALKQAGILHTVLLTGDKNPAAEAVQKQAGIDEFRGELLPQHKLEQIREMGEREGAVIPLNLLRGYTAPLAKELSKIIESYQDSLL
jgi:Cd2+/Zn2+-exporting ATPase